MLFLAKCFEICGPTLWVSQGIVGTELSKQEEGEHGDGKRWHSEQ